MRPDSTPLLLDLAARAPGCEDHTRLEQMLREGHHAWCEGYAQIRARVLADCSGLDDAALAERCAQHGTPWEEGTEREAAVSDLAFAIWDASPAAMAYTELAEHCADVGVCLLPTERRGPEGESPAGGV